MQTTMLRPPPEPCSSILPNLPIWPIRHHHPYILSAELFAWPFESETRVNNVCAFSDPGHLGRSGGWSSPPPDHMTSSRVRVISYPPPSPILCSLTWPMYPFKTAQNHMSLPPHTFSNFPFISTLSHRFNLTPRPI